MKTISCTLSTIDKAIAELSNYQKALKSKAESITSQVADYCELEAETNFGKAIYDGTNDVFVSTESEGLVSYVIANGEAVAFIEFGTGVTYTDPHPIKPTSLGLAPRGKYGYGLGKMRDGWYYDGEPGTNGVLMQKGKHAGRIKTRGNPANRCLYDAEVETKKQVKDIAKKVFADD